MCILKTYVDAPIEEQRFCTLQTWLRYQPDFVWDKDMTSQIDSFLRQTNKSRIEYIISEIIIASGNIETVTMEKNHTTKEISELTQVCLDSKPLRIDCEWTRNSEDRSLSWKWVNFTFHLDDSTSRFFSVNMSSLKSPKENGFESVLGDSNESVD